MRQGLALVFLLWLVGLHGLTSAEWLPLIEAGAPFCMYHNPCYWIQTNPNTRLTHTAYCGKDTAGIVRLYYMQLISNDTTTQPLLLDAVHECRLAVVMETNVEGTSLMAVMEAKRDPNGIACNETDLTGCIDTFFLESKDTGLTWTQPNPVPRPDLNDPTNRITPSLLPIVETGRVWIFYGLDNPNKTGIGAVSRPPGSLIFTDERLVNVPYVHAPYYPKLSYTLNEGNPVLHLGWTERWGKPPYEIQFEAKYTRSQNGGIAWDPPSTLCISAYVGVTALTASHSRPYVFLSFFNYTEGGNHYVIWSADHGATWSTRILITPRGAPSGSIAVCEDSARKEPTAFVAVDDYFSRIKFGVLNTTSGKYEELESGFYGLTFTGGPVVNCFYLPAMFLPTIVVESPNKRLGISLYFNRFQHYYPLPQSAAAL